MIFVCGTIDEINVLFSISSSFPKKLSLFCIGFEFTKSYNWYAFVSAALIIISDAAVKRLLNISITLVTVSTLLLL